MAGLYRINDLLELMLREGAAAINLAPGSQPVLQSHGQLLPIEVHELTSDNILELLESVATQGQLDELQSCGKSQFIFRFQNSARFSVIAALDHDVLTVTIKNLGR